jgi:4-hydroxybenzoate polyprenyltransferase
MSNSVQLYDPGLEEYPLRGVILNNIVFASVLVAGTIACWLISPVFGIAYLVTFAVLVYGVMRRLTCTRCYYYGKRCGSGWGLLAARCFKRGNIEEFNQGAGVKIAPLVYGLMILVPLVALAVLAFQNVTTTLVVLVAFLLGMSFYSSGPGRRRVCSVCKMRTVCKGSAAK